MNRLLNADPRQRKLHLINQDNAKHPRYLSGRFPIRAQKTASTKIIDEKAVKLLENNQPRGVDITLDASFTKTWSTRHSTGYPKRMLRPLIQELEYQAGLSPLATNSTCE